MKSSLIKNRLLPLVVIPGLAVYQYLTPPVDALNEQAGSQAGVVEIACAEQRSKVWVKTQGHCRGSDPLLHNHFHVKMIESLEI